MNVSCSAEPCPILLDSTCVFYSGANLIYTGITTNDSLQVALQKIDAKFQDAGIGYAFQNGIIQSSPGQPVKLGGSLNQNTTINSGPYTFALTGTIQSSAFITAGGTSSQFVKGDGSLDNTSYQPAGTYITALTGDGTATGPGSAVFSLDPVSALFSGTWGSATQVPRFVLDTKGRVLSVTNVPINLPPTFLTFVGDVYGSGPEGSNINLTISNVLGTPGTFGSTTQTPVITVNAKGQITAISQVPSGGGGGGGTVTAVTASTPLASSGGATPNITIQQASGSQNGFLSSTDWTTFNGKQNAITLTTTGTSGAATFIANTLNIPQYQAAGTYVTSVGATGPITSSGGTTPTISTSMATNRLIGRTTAGTGVMEEISVGTGLTLSSGTLSATAQVPGFEQHFLLMGA